MPYRRGDLQKAAPDDPDDGYNSTPYDARADKDIAYSPFYAYLPHSCDSWIIGGPDEIRTLIEDLTKLLEEK